MCFRAVVAGSRHYREGIRLGDATRYGAVFGEDSGAFRDLFGNKRLIPRSGTHGTESAY